jgi:formamidopyrimidine-DNA glycosylase
MPELPEVETVVLTLRPILVGKTIARVDLRRPDIVTPADCDLCKRLKGAVIQSIHRRGKRIIFTLKTGQRFYIHLGMSGRLTLAAPSEPIPVHTHLILNFGNRKEGEQLRFRDPRRFGGVWWLSDTDDGAGIMGPEPLPCR